MSFSKSHSNYTKTILTFIGKIIDLEIWTLIILLLQIENDMEGIMARVYSLNTSYKRWINCSPTDIYIAQAIRIQRNY